MTPPTDPLDQTQAAEIHAAGRGTRTDAPIDPLKDTETAGELRTAAHEAPISPTDRTLSADELPPARRPLAGSTHAINISRYVFLERLGEGGMGVVVAAYDPKLDRRVAIKLLNTPRRDDSERRLRMEREAQAMAKLSHPNVVTVYEVGEYEGQLFLAMEFVKGQDLRRWLTRQDKPINWRMVLDVFIQAGQGLAAAHRAGLVHRDFKPDNVFVGEDGRVRVGDFGLARQGIESDAETVATRLQAQVGANATALAHEITATGAMMGTPAYMAPEQFEGELTDARTDQFSFCVALWEALYGQRPFAGTTLAEIIVNVTGGNRVPPPAGARVPAWVRKVLDRGLSLAPGERYPSTEEMLTALQADPTRRRRVLAGVAGMALATAGWFGLQHYLETRQVAACEEEGASIAAVWNEETRMKLRDGLLATGVSYAQTTTQNIMPYFDVQAEAWKEARTEACLDKRVRKNWDENTFERSVWCLDERRMELEALVAELTQANATAVQRAADAAAGLSQVEPCRDAHRLNTLPPLPPDRQSVKAVLGTLSRAVALRAAGDYKEGQTVARQALATAEQLGWPPLTAAARWSSGTSLASDGLYAEAEKELEMAYFQASEVGALDVAANAALNLVAIVGYRRARHDEGIRWSRHADIALSALGVGEESLRRAEALANLANVHESMGAYEQAKALLERALTIREKSVGPDHPLVATSLHDLALVLQSMGKYEEAKLLFERALAIRQKALGIDHPEVASTLDSIAIIHDAMGEYDQAKVLLERALDIRRVSLNPDHPDIATSFNNMATVHQSMGAYAQAKEMFEQSVAIREKSLGPNHPDVASALGNLAGTHEAMGAYQQAKTLHERALKILERDPDHRNFATGLNNLALVNLYTGEYDEARRLFERALAIYETALGGNHPDVALALNNVGYVHALTGAYDQAKTLHQRALAIREDALPPDHPDIANSLNNLAGLHVLIGEYSEAKPLYEHALKIDEKASGPNHPNLAYYLTGLTKIALAEGRPGDAVTLAERAVRILEASNTAEERLGQSRFVLARALWNAPANQGRDRDRALSLARQARDAFSEAKGKDKELREVDVFLENAKRP